MINNDNRWWEYYLARYIAANIFAVLVLFYLVAFKGDEIKTSLCGDKTTPSICAKKNFSGEVFSFIFITTKEVKANKEAWVIKDTKNENDIAIYDVGSIKDAKNDIAIYESGFILHKGSEINVTELNFANIFVLGVFGFLYMYVSSLPIYFLHITRGVWKCTMNVKSNCCFVQFFKKYYNYNYIVNCIAILLTLILYLYKIKIAPLALLLFLLNMQKIHDYLKKSAAKRDQVESRSENKKITSAPFYRNSHYNKNSTELYSPEYIRDTADIKIPL